MVVAWLAIVIGLLYLVGGGDGVLLLLVVVLSGVVVVAVRDGGGGGVVVWWWYRRCLSLWVRVVLESGNASLCPCAHRISTASTMFPTFFFQRVKSKQVLRS